MDDYSLRKYMSRLYDERGRQYPLDATSKEAYFEWKERVRKRLFDITGLNIIMSMEQPPLNPRLISEKKCDGYTLQSWDIQTEKDVLTPFYLLIPDHPNGAAMLNPHGHGGGKDVSILSTDNLYVKNMVENLFPPGHKTFALEAVSRGYIVACPDARGSGDRREVEQRQNETERPENYRVNSHREINQMGIGFGISMVGFMVWDLMKITDFLLTLPQVDPKRIGCLGMSGGGQQTIFLAALDERISAAVTSGYFYGYKDALLLQPANCSCNFVPHLWETLDMGDIGAMIAPRALLVESGKADHLNGASGISNVISQVDIAREAFKLFDADEKIFHSIHEDGHKYKGTDVFPFLEKWL
ncbi:MAG: alpha/beta hydrolase family protein [Christensenellales bacterium]|jgi:hypothetical protein